MFKYKIQLIKLYFLTRIFNSFISNKIQIVYLNIE